MIVIDFSSNEASASIENRYQHGHFPVTTGEQLQPGDHAVRYDLLKLFLCRTCLGQGLIDIIFIRYFLLNLLPQPF